MTPLAGDYIVFKSTGWAARAIQYGTRSRWNHAAIALGDGFIVEAVPSGIRRTALADYDHREYVVGRRHLTSWQRSKVCAYATSRIGAGYGWLDIAALALVALGIRPAWLDNFAANDDRLVCSQLVAYAYAAAGERLTDDDAWTVTPGDLADLILTDS